MSGWNTRIEELLAQLESEHGARVAALASALVREVMALYADALRAAVAVIRAQPDGHTLLRRLVDGEESGPLLALHGLHPDGPVARIDKALDRVRAVTGGGIDVVQVRDGVAVLRLAATIPRAPHAEDAIRTAAHDAAPELDRIEFVRLPPLLAIGRRPPSEPR